jgi:hypothetical protein
MKYVLLLLLTLPLFSQAQNHSDSVSHYSKEMGQMLRKAYDSIVRSDAYKEARKKMNYHA